MISIPRGEAPSLFPMPLRLRLRSSPTECRRIRGAVDRHRRFPLPQQALHHGVDRSCGVDGRRGPPGLREAFERTIYALRIPGTGLGEARTAPGVVEFDSSATLASHPDGSVEFHERLRLWRAAGDAGARPFDRHRKPSGVPAGRSHRMVNGSQGLEQGFTFAHRPQASMNNPLVIALDGRRFHAAAKGRRGAPYIPQGYCVALCRSDSSGRRGTLSSRWEANGSEIRLVVEDRRSTPRWSTRHGLSRCPI